MRQRPIRTRKAAAASKAARLHSPPSLARRVRNFICIPPVRHCCGTGDGAIINLAQNPVAFSTRPSMRRNSVSPSRLRQRRAKRLRTCGKENDYNINPSLLSWIKWDTHGAWHCNQVLVIPSVKCDSKGLWRWSFSIIIKLCYML